MVKPIFVKMDRVRAGEVSAKAAEMLRRCVLCPRECGVDRHGEERGFCGAGAEVEISSANAHFGEEPPISGSRGSGTIFLTHCNLKCVFCQNYPISHMGNGKAVTNRDIVEHMLNLQKRGCHNINFVTPTHYMPQIAEAVVAAAEKGLRIPIVYNCGGYESLEALRLLDGLIDIYMPDIKYVDPEMSTKYSGVADYFECASLAVKEMHRQVGDLQMDSEGIATRGLLIRHLVMPGGALDSARVFRFIADEISPDTFVSVMAQYFPAFKAVDMSEIAERLRPEEYRQAVDAAEEAGLARGWIQGDILELP